MSVGLCDFNLMYAYSLVTVPRPIPLESAWFGHATKRGCETPRVHDTRLYNLRLLYTVDVVMESIRILAPNLNICGEIHSLTETYVTSIIIYSGAWLTATKVTSIIICVEIYSGTWLTATYVTSITICVQYSGAWLTATKVTSMIMCRNIQWNLVNRNLGDQYI